MTLSVDERVGWALRTRRGRSAISQAQAARRIGVARQRLSAAESGDSTRGLGHLALRRLDDLLGAEGELLHLRNRLHRLRGPEARRDLLTIQERLDLNHALRDGEDVPRDQALYVGAFELVAAGAGGQTDRTASRRSTSSSPSRRWPTTSCSPAFSCWWSPPNRCCSSWHSSECVRRRRSACGLRTCTLISRTSSAPLWQTPLGTCSATCAMPAC